MFSIEPGPITGSLQFPDHSSTMSDAMLDLAVLEADGSEYESSQTRLSLGTGSHPKKWESDRVAQQNAQENFEMSNLRQKFATLGLSQYLGGFIDEGFDTWASILDITESDL
jgi:hypothetical protein